MATGTDLTGNTNIVINVQNKNKLDLAKTLDSLSINTGIIWTYGTEANKANVLYHDTVVNTDGGNTPLNLKDSGTLLDHFGNPLTMSAIKLLYIKNRSTDSVLEIFGSITNDLLIVSGNADSIDLPAGASFLWMCPTADGVSLDAQKTLLLTDDGSGAEGDKLVDVVILGLD